MADAVQLRITPPTRDLGDGFVVRRAIPTPKCKSVGPFVFFDAFGPVAVAPGKGLDVRPHPHIGLATVTYLFEGEILHRDSLGSVQPIRPGEVNWMTAGSGIVHSERTPPALRASGTRIAGIQLWVALPLENEEAEPAFAHYEDLPTIERDGVSIQVILGALFGCASPVKTLSPMSYAAASIPPQGALALTAQAGERAMYVFDGSVVVGGEAFAAGELAVLDASTPARIEASSRSRVLVIGGPALDAPRYVWWNFVSSRKERIREAASRWKAQRFPPVPGETEFIPLPEHGPAGIVDYP